MALATTSAVFGIGSAIYSAVGAVNGLVQGFANGEIDSAGDFFNVLFGGGTDEANEEINRKLDELLAAVDDLSDDIEELGRELKQQIDAQTDLLVELDVTQLLASIDSRRAQLSSFDPNATPGEPGYVAPENRQAYFRGFTEDSDELLQQLTGIAETVTTPTAGYTPSIDIILSAAAAVAYAIDFRMQVAGRFERDELAATRLTDGLERAATFFQDIGQQIQDTLEVDVFMQPNTSTGELRVDYDGDGTEDVVSYGYEYYESFVTSNLVGDTGFVRSTFQPPEVALFQAEEVTVTPDGDGGFNAFMSDTELLVDAASLPAFVANPLGQDQQVLDLDASGAAQRFLANETLSLVAYWNTLARLGVEAGDSPDAPESDYYAGLAATLFAQSNGVDDRTPDMDGSLTGTEGRDLLYGDATGNAILGLDGNDSLRGRDGDDTIRGGAGDDLIRGDAGDDLLEGGTGANVLRGHDGDDTLRSESIDRIEGGPDNDLIDGLRFAEMQVFAGEGDDTIRVAADNRRDQVLSAGPGDDVVESGAGDDLIAPGTGNDSIVGGGGLDTAVFSGAEADYTLVGFDFLVSNSFGIIDIIGFDVTVTGPEGRNVLQEMTSLQFADRNISLSLPGLHEVTDGTDILVGSRVADDDLNGGGGDDAIHGSRGNDTLAGASGNDTLVGGFESDSLLGGTGNDRLDGAFGNDMLNGGDGADTLIGGDGDDFLFGGDSEADLRDVIYAGDGDDRLDGGHGNDELHGGNGTDTVLGGFGNDTLIGNAGDDVIAGGPGSDAVFGGPGNDTINGGFGFDRINGGDGADRFFHTGAKQHASDWIQDYDAAEGDVLVFGDLSATRDDFHVTMANTPRAGADDVAEAFVIYRPTDPIERQIMWALVDGDGNDSINIQLNGQVFDLLA